MIPEVPTVLGGLARIIAADLGAEVRSAYAGLTVQLTSVLLMMIAQEFDRAAARLAEENQALVNLFRDAADQVPDAPLQAELRAAAAEAPVPSLFVSELRRRNRQLRALLIRLHERVESLEGDSARVLEEKIWAELIASTRRRHLDLANG